MLTRVERMTINKRLNKLMRRHLSLREVKISASTREKLVMRSLLDDRAFVYDGDRVGVDDRREAVGDDYARSTFARLVERRLHHLLAICIKRACRLVEQ